MKMVLVGRSKDRRNKMSKAVVFAGATYEHHGSEFTDDVGESILVCLFTWKAIDLREPVPSLKDDDREEPVPKLDSHESLTFGPLLEDRAMRFNEGKAELSYIMSLPNACAGVSAAFAMGAQKYARNNWKKGLDRNQLVDSALRHLSKSQNGEVFDEESGLDHLFHFAWNALVLAEQEGLVKNENNS